VGSEEPTNCANCGRQIGGLETHMVYQDHCVCADCYQRLANQDRAAGSPGTANLPSVQPAAPAGEGYAIASLICGLMAYVFIPLLGAILAVIFGHLAISQSKSANAPTPGLATAGLILGWVQLGFLLLLLLLMLLFAFFAFAMSASQ